MRLGLENMSLEASQRERWNKQHFELGTFHVENLTEESRLLPKQINDRIWQAFHLTRANIFDDAGTFRSDA